MCIGRLVDFLFYIGHTENLLYVKGIKSLKPLEKDRALSRSRPIPEFRRIFPRSGNYLHTEVERF
jgi:hypothetical protein